MVRGDLRIFSANKSFLLRKRMMLVSLNHLLLQMESNSFIDSIIRFWNETTRTWTKMAAVCKQKVGWTHHFVVFGKNEVVLAHRNDEDDGSDSFETMNPLLALRSLTTNVEHSGKNHQTRSNIKRLLSVWKATQPDYNFYRQHTIIPVTEYIIRFPRNYI